MATCSILIAAIALSATTVAVAQLQPPQSDTPPLEPIVVTKSSGAYPRVAMFCFSCGPDEYESRPGTYALVVPLRTELDRLGGTLYILNTFQGTPESARPAFDVAATLDLTFGIVEANMFELCKELVAKSPHTKFLSWYEAAEPVPWYQTTTPRGTETGYMTGVMLGLMSKTSKVAFLSSVTTFSAYPNQVTGFFLGLRAVCPTCEGWSSRLGTSAPVPLAQKMARKLYGLGYDSFMAISAQHTVPFIFEAKAAGGDNVTILRITFDTTPYRGLPHRAWSMYVDNAGATLSALHEILTDTWVGGNRVRGIAEGGLRAFGCDSFTLTPCDDNRPPASPVVVRALHEYLYDGEHVFDLHKQVREEQFGALSKYAYPELNPNTLLPLDDVFGPTVVWRDPHFAAMGDQPVYAWKVVVLDADRTASTTYSAHQNAIDPWPFDWALEPRKVPPVSTGYTFTGFPYFGVLHGGRMPDGTILGDVVTMRHSCGDHKERCSADPVFTWLTGDVTHLARFHHSAVAVGSDGLLVFGGLGGSPLHPEPLRDLWLMNLTTLNTTRLSPAPQPRFNHTAAYWKCHRGILNRLVVVGGFQDASTAATDTMVYDVLTDAWTVVPGGPNPVQRPCVFAWEDRVHVFGGAGPTPNASHTTYTMFHEAFMWHARSDANIQYPAGQYECAVIPTADATVFGATDNVKHTPAAMHKVIFAVVADAAGQPMNVSSKALFLRTIPSLNCSVSEGFMANEQGFGCVHCPFGVDPMGSPGGRATCVHEPSSSGDLMLRIVIAFSASAVAASIAVAVFLQYRRNSRRLNSFIEPPRANPVALAVIEVRSVDGGGSARGENELTLLRTLRKRCLHSGIYEVYAFGSQITLASADALALLRNLVDVLCSMHTWPRANSAYACAVVHMAHFSIRCSGSGAVTYDGPNLAVLRKGLVKCRPWTIWTSKTTMKDQPIFRLSTDLPVTTFSDGHAVLVPKVFDSLREGIEKKSQALARRAAAARPSQPIRPASNDVGMEGSLSTESLGPAAMAMLVAEIMSVLHTQKSVLKAVVRGHGLLPMARTGQRPALRRALVKRLLQLIDPTIVATFEQQLRTPQHNKRTIASTTDHDGLSSISESLPTQ